MGPPQFRNNTRGIPFTNAPVGGSSQLILNNEVIFPLVQGIGLKGVVFFDAGNAYGGDENNVINDARYAAGGGLRWLSPLGPFRWSSGSRSTPAYDQAADPLLVRGPFSSDRSNSHAVQECSSHRSSARRAGRVLAASSAAWLALAGVACGDQDRRRRPAARAQRVRRRQEAKEQVKASSRIAEQAQRRGPRQGARRLQRARRPAEGRRPATGNAS
jgi:hypothetical protein